MCCIVLKALPLSPVPQEGECHCTDPYWGPECDQDCPVSNHDNTAVCDSHGHCRKTDGVCVCQSRWTGVVYNYSDYTTGYIDSNADYACTVCSVGWYGTDCSTALLERAVNGSDGYALISSSVIITVDGASMELSKTGGYRWVVVWVSLCRSRSAFLSVCLSVCLSVGLSVCRSV